jgi:phage-related protein
MQVNFCIMKLEIKYYQFENGRYPVKEYIDSFPEKTITKIFWTLELIESIEKVPKKFLKKISKNVWEIRVQFGNNTFRFLGFFDGKKIVILNHAFTKKTQKTPKKEIKIAESRREDYFRRKKNE